MAELKVGDRVAFSADFCHNTGQIAGSVPHARGVIQAISPARIATVKWDGDPEEVAAKAHVANLCKVGSREFSRS